MGGDALMCPPRFDTCPFPSSPFLQHSLIHFIFSSISPFSFLEQILFFRPKNLFFFLSCIKFPIFFCWVIIFFFLSSLSSNLLHSLSRASKSLHPTHPPISQHPGVKVRSE